MQPMYVGGIYQNVWSARDNTAINIFDHARFMSWSGDIESTTLSVNRWVDMFASSSQPTTEFGTFCQIPLIKIGNGTTIRPESTETLYLIKF